MTTPRADRRLAAILAADVVGYSRLMGADETATLMALRQLRRAIIEPAIARGGGRIVKTAGDGFLVEFPSVVEAANAAIEIQRATEALAKPLPADRQFRLRMGINIGDIVYDDGDIYGDGVNIAARLEALAQPGGICLSGTAFQHVKGRIDVPVIPLGPMALKNIADKIDVFSIDFGDGAPRAVARFSMSGWRKYRPIAVAGIGALALAGAAAIWVIGVDRPLPTPPTPGAAQAVLAPTLNRPIVAVLPLANLSGDPSQDYFSDGLTEDLIGALGRFSSLAVLTRSAVAGFGRSDASPAEIGKSLGARFIVQGSVRASGQRMRVSVQLSDAGTGLVMWSQQFDASLTDAASVQDEIIRQIAGRLAIQVHEIEANRATQKPTQNLEAYDFFLRGRQLLIRSVRSANVEARAYLLKAVAADPQFAAAQAALADSYYRFALAGWAADPQATLAQAEEIARKALALDPRSVDALVVLSKINGMLLNFDKSLLLAREAIKINPSDAQAYYRIGSALTWLGQLDEAIPALEIALALGYPLDHAERFEFGMAFYLVRRYDRALEILIDPVAGAPQRYFSQALLAAIYAELGELDKARAALATAKKLAPFFIVEEFGNALQDRAQALRLGDALRKAGAN